VLIELNLQSLDFLARHLRGRPRTVLNQIVISVMTRFLGRRVVFELIPKFSDLVLELSDDLSVV
jgi:hypothetical protein